MQTPALKIISDQMLHIFEFLRRELLVSEDMNSLQIKAKLEIIQTTINEANRALLKMMLEPNRKDSGMMAQFLTYGQRLRDKLQNLFVLADEFRQFSRSESEMKSKKALQNLI